MREHIFTIDSGILCRRVPHVRANNTSLPLKTLKTLKKVFTRQEEKKNHIAVKPFKPLSARLQETANKTRRIFFGILFFFRQV